MASVPERSGTVAVGGTELAYLRIGAGTPMVVMAGGPRMGFAHLRVGFDRFADECEVVYYDERGSGNSPLDDTALVSTAGTLSDLDALVDGLDIRRAVLAGHSVAAHMVALYAGTRPDRVQALVLANPGPPLVPELRESFGKEMASRRTPEDVDEMKRIEESAEFAAKEPAALEEHYRRRYVPFFRARENALAADFAFTEITAANILDAPDRQFSDFADHAPPKTFGAIACPTLVVHSELDPIPLESSRFIANAIPGAELTVIAGENHFAFIENPDAFAAAIKPFLARHATS